MELFRQMSAVLAVFTLLGLLLWILRRGGLATLRRAPRGPRALESMERLALTPTHALHMVRIRGHVLVVATHPQGWALLMDRVETEQE
jgi:flagellar biogenesis protein FliO